MGSLRGISPSATSQPLMAKYQLEADVRPIQPGSTASTRFYVLVSLSAVMSVALIIAVGVGLSPDSRPLPAGAELNRIVPQFQPQVVEFDFQSTDEYIPGPNDTDVPSAIWEKRTAMLPVGNGVLDIPEYAEYPHLTEPIAPMTEERKGLSMFSTAWVHQLHCLVSFGRVFE
ncbi:hypothetical protein NLG97_g5243 [Lecanicillium saksenae]|uniref:Uncharacterized protein n=1 Tax=Lecanicillium saksenae TaxID=468837 RepID=A0ACC1QW80_9HYPO|nr:hypothetical protein NLG97_g5243 [Lecanicillium saksenae]